jgi:hypothetical protein
MQNANQLSLCRAREWWYRKAADRIVQALSIFAINTTGGEFVDRWRAKAKPLRSEIGDVIAIYRLNDLTDFAVRARQSRRIIHTFW